MTEQEKLRLKALARQRMAQQQGQGQPQSFAQSVVLPDAPVVAGSDPIASNAQADYDNAPFWKKPLMAADDMANVLADSATFGVASKGMAHARAFMHGTEYDQERSMIDQMVGDSRKRSGLAGTIAGVSGGVKTALGLAGKGITAMRVPYLGATGGAIVDGASLGAVDAFGHDENMLKGAGIGALGGLAGKFIGDGANKIAGGIRNYFKGEPGIPTLAQITKEGSNKYAASEAENVVYTPAGIQNLLKESQDAFAQRTFRPNAQPGAATALKELQADAASGLPVTAEGLKSIRTVANEQFQPGKDSSNTLLNILKSKIDDFRMNPKEGDILSGDGVKAAKLSKEADALWSQKKKIETVRKAVKVAENRAARTGTGGNGENNVKQELSKILNDPRKGRGFTGDEKAAIEKVVFNQTGRDILRTVSRLNPFSHALSGGGAAMGTGAILGPAAPVVTTLAGMISSGVGKGIQNAKVKKLEKLIATGGNSKKLAQVLEGNKLIGKDKRELLQRLLAIGAASQLGQP